MGFEVPSRGVSGAGTPRQENIADFHRRQVQQSWLNTAEDGTVLGQRIRD